MALAGAMPENGARRWLSQPSSTPTIVTVGCGIVLGIAVLVIAQRPTRWLVYMMAGLLLVVVSLAGGMRRRSLLGYLIVGLSLNVHYYLTQPEPLFYLGISSATWFSIPLVLLPALALAVSLLLEAVTGGTPLRLGLPVTKYALLVLATATVSSLLSPVRRYGIFAVAEMLQYFFIYLVAVNVVRSADDVKFAVRTLLVTLGIQAAIFMIQTATGVTFNLTGEVVRATAGELIRASGTVGTTPSGYAIFVEPLLFTALALWRVREPGISRAWTGGLTLIGGITLMLTLNRTSWLTLLIGSVIVELLCRWRGVARPLPLSTRVSLIAAVVLATIIVIPLIIPRLNQAHSDDWSSRRDLMWIAVSMIKGNFLVGVGPGGYPYHVRQYAPSHVSGEWLWVVHNEFLLIWAERGILGFLAWLAWLRSGIGQALLATTAPERQLQALGIGCTAGFLGLLWEYSLNMWPPFSCYALLWCLFGLLVAGNNVYADARHDDLAAAI